METKLRNLRPYEAFDDSVRRSFAAGAAGFVLIGSLQAAGVVPIIYRDSVAIVSGMLAAFLTALALSVAYYHRRWKLAVGGSVLSLALPYVGNVLWARFSDRSLIYPTIAIGLLGVFLLRVVHQKISGPRWEDNIEEQLIKDLIEDVDSTFTWKDRVTWLCFAGGVILLLVLWLR
jgi:hypothetical protein